MTINIRPEMQVGDNILVRWTDRDTYRGVLQGKLRKNWSVKISDSDWHHRQNFASVPAHALVKWVH